MTISRIQFKLRSEDVTLTWKWERRLIQQTAVKKQPLPWNKLLLEKNRDTVTNTLQEANSKKNGTYTLLKMQVTIFLKSERSDESGDVAINESSGRVVCASFCFANHRLRHLDLIQTASLLFIPDSEVYQGIANEISLFRLRSKWS